MHLSFFPSLYSHKLMAALILSWFDLDWTKARVI